MYGFGAMWDEMGHGSVSHIFPLSGSDSKPFVKSTTRMIKCYKKVVQESIFLGPTYICPSLKKCLKIIKKQSKKNKYYYSTI